MATVSDVSNSNSKGGHVEGVEKGDVYVWTGSADAHIFIHYVIIISETLALCYRYDGTANTETSTTKFRHLLAVCAL